MTDVSLTVESLTRGERSGKRENPDHDKLLVRPLMRDFRYLRLGDRSLELLDLLNFNLFGYRDLSDERVSFFFFRCLRLSRLRAILDWSVAFYIDQLGGIGTPFLRTFLVSE